MRCSALYIVLLAISEPLLIHAKVVLVVPRQIRRSPSPPVLRSPQVHYKKSSYKSNDLHHNAYHSPANRYYNRKPFRPLPYPHGGDDFDQGHEAVNHVHIPYGKDVGHGISFGKGYIPYDSIKSSNLPFVHERYAGAYAPALRRPAIPDYSPTGFTSVGQEYTASATAHHSYETPYMDSFFSDMENVAARGELPDSLKDGTSKYYAARSIEKDLNLRNQQALGNVVEKGTEDLPKDVPQTAYGHTASAADIQGAVVLPAGIPSATIAGNKDGIVLRDTVSLDEYQRKLEELTKAWPSMLSAVGAPSNYATAAVPAPYQQLHAAAVDHYPIGASLSSSGFSGSGFSPTGGGAAWFSSFAQPKQGYAVREDHGDRTTHDFRTMPIHTAPYQQLPLGVNVQIGAGVARNLHG